MRTAPNVRIVATSRQPLDIADEEPVRIPSLNVPHAIADLSASKVVEFAAVALFVARATTADRTFVLTDDTAPIVADICRRLDGIPLAIELAAARVKVLSIAHLAERLNERFKLLTGSSRDLLPRQKTLSALLDWSYDLLTAQEQLLFTRLGIFASGFTLEAATRVCGGDGLDELDILDLLGSLTDKSLVVADTSGELERYRLLESTAAYALEKLHASGEHEAMVRRHAEYYRDQALAADERFITGSTLAWVAAAELEVDNYRAALTWALTQGNDAPLGGAIAGALSRLWGNGGLSVEGRYWIQRAIENVTDVEEPRIAARLHLTLSSLSSGKRSYTAAERAMKLYAAADDISGAARAQNSVAGALLQMGDLDVAKAAVEQSLMASRACEDTRAVANALNTQANIEYSQGNVRTAREGFAKALAAYKALENEYGIAVVLCNVAELEFADGHPDEALRAVSDAMKIDVRGNAEQIAIDYINSAAYQIALDDLAPARESAREGLRVARQGRFEVLIAVALQHLGLLAALGSDGSRAAQLLGYVDGRFTEEGYKRGTTERWCYDKLIAALRQTMGEDEVEQLSAQGATWSEDRAVEEAMRL